MATSQENQNVENFQIGLLDYDPEDGEYYTKGPRYPFSGTLEEAKTYARHLIDKSRTTEMGARIFGWKDGEREIVSEFWYSN